MRGRSRSSGFTLIEMVVALSILAMVLLATVTGLRTLAATQTGLERQTGQNDELRAVSSFLREALESSIVGQNLGGLSVGGGGAQKTAFQAHPNRLLWKTSMRFGEGEGGSYLVRVTLEGRKLVLRWQRPNMRGAVGDWNNAPARTLLESVDSFEVAYRRVPGGEWQAGWDGAGVPRWVRLRLSTRGRFWPDMVMQVAR